MKALTYSFSLLAVAILFISPLRAEDPKATLTPDDDQGCLVGDEDDFTYEVDFSDVRVPPEGTPDCGEWVDDDREEDEVDWECDGISVTKDGSSLTISTSTPGYAKVKATCVQHWKSTENEDETTTTTAYSEEKEVLIAKLEWEAGETSMIRQTPSSIAARHKHGSAPISLSYLYVRIVTQKLSRQLAGERLFITKVRVHRSPLLFNNKRTLLKS